MQAVTKMIRPDDDRIERQFRKICPRGLRLDESMAKHTTIGTGGPVRYFAVPSSPAKVVGLVRAALEFGVDYIGIGRGSNLLVRDGGFDGLVIRVASNMAATRVYKRTVYAEAGVSFTRLARIMLKNGRPGFEFAVGIPGSVGGAVRMNAGAFGSELSGVIKSAKIVDADGRIVVLKPGDLAFRYRHSALHPRAIVLSVIFNGRPGTVDAEQLRRSLGRKETQPLSQRSFGSTFTNPPGRFAAQMIEACGLKGEQWGGVMISKKHANFIVNVGEQTRANDVEDLMQRVVETVEARFGIRLQPEVVIVGNR